MGQQYKEAHLEAKKSKRKIRDEYEKARTNFVKMTSDYETAQKNLDAALADYQQLVKKKEEAPALMKLEFKARLIKQELDSLKNKLADGKDHLNDQKLKVYDENDKIRLFVNTWNEQRENVFRQILHTVITLMDENLNDVDRSFENLIVTLNQAITVKEEKEKEKEKEKVEEPLLVEQKNTTSIVLDEPKSLSPQKSEEKKSSKNL